MMMAEERRTQFVMKYYSVAAHCLSTQLLIANPSRYYLLQWILITTSRMMNRTPRRPSKQQQTPKPSTVSRRCWSRWGAGGPSSGTSPRSTSCSASTSAPSPTPPSSRSSPRTTSAGWRSCTTSPWRTGGSWPSHQIRDQVKYYLK